jgi:acetyl-CoA C-acetyltransferase
MAAVGERVRAEPGSLGAVTTVSGLLTKPGVGVWSARPDGWPPLLADLAAEVGSATGVLEVVETLDGYEGTATVVTYTVTYDGMDPVRTVALCDTDDGRRCVAVSGDAGLAAHGIAHELIGTRVVVGQGTFAPA